MKRIHILDLIFYIIVMPYFPERNLVFIHLSRNAGSVIEEHLIGRRPDLFVSENNNGVKFIGHEEGLNKVLQHLTFGELRERMSPEEFDRAKIFTVIRHPYDRIVSDFEVFHGKVGMEEFREFLNQYLDDHQNKETNEEIDSRLVEIYRNFDGHYIQQHKFLLNAEGVIDPRVKILRYENLNEDIKAIVPELSGRFLKNTPNPCLGFYLSDPKIKQKIDSYYAEDFRLFGYSPVIPHLPQPNSQQKKNNAQKAQRKKKIKIQNQRN